MGILDLTTPLSIPYGVVDGNNVGIASLRLMHREVCADGLKLENAQI